MLFDDRSKSSLRLAVLREECRSWRVSSNRYELKMPCESMYVYMRVYVHIYRINRMGFACCIVFACVMEIVVYDFAKNIKSCKRLRK